MSRIEKIKNSFWGFFIEKRSVSWLFIIGITISGVMAWQNMPREIQPEINIPIGSVFTALPGANPTDTESLITEPLEQQIANIDDIKSLTSTSGFGTSSIIVEFEASADLDEAIDNLKAAVDIAKIELPEDASEPQVVKAAANDFSIVTYAVTGPYPIHELTDIAEDKIKPALENISQVSSAEVLGGQNAQIEVVLDQKKVEGYGLSISDIANIIEFSNSNLPVGVITSDQISYSIRIDNRYQNLNDLRKLPITTIQGSDTILLQDIAKIDIAYPEQSVLTRFSANGERSQPAVSVQLFKKDDTNILEIVDESREVIADLKENGEIADNINIQVSNDNAAFIRTDLGILTRSGIQTTILITIILFLALGLRQGLLAGLSIPIIFLAAFTVMDFQGSTINSLSLFSLVIALGLMVDTTIVIMEGIHEYMKNGYNAKEAALLSVDTYKWPLVAGTMTTIFAFFPMLLVSGILGEFLKTLPLTISATLFGSLLISLTIAPSIATKFLHKDEGKPTHKPSPMEPIFERLQNVFNRFSNFLIAKRRRRISVYLVISALFLASLALPISGLLKVEMFPKTDVYYFFINIESPKGVTIDDTATIVSDIEKELYGVAGIESFLSIIGSGNSQAISDTIEPTGASTNSNLANITVNLLPREEREKASYEIAADIRETLSNYQKAKVTVEEISEGPPSDPPITVRITGTDLEALKEISGKVLSITESIPETENVNSTFETGLNEFKFTLDPDRLSRYNLSAFQVASTIRNIIQGVEATTVTFAGEEYDIIVKYNLGQEQNRTNISIQDIENFEINTPGGTSIPLSQIADYEFGESLSSIQREDEKRIAKITSELKTDANAVEITAKIQSEIDKLDVPANIKISFGGDLEEIQESFQELFSSMFIGVMLIGFSLVLMFNSYREPLIILSSLPLALIGVFPGLMLIGLALSFPAFLGVVALTGVVVNDAIVLLDRIGTNRREEKMKLLEAITEASTARLQPIIITSITTIVGILPLALTNEFWAGLGFALIFGLAFSTILTLLVIPSLYFTVNRRKAIKEGTL